MPNRVSSSFSAEMCRGGMRSFCSSKMLSLSRKELSLARVVYSYSGDISNLCSLTSVRSNINFDLLFMTNPTSITNLSQD